MSTASPPSLLQPSAYYSAFSYTAPRDCPHCSGLGYVQMVSRYGDERVPCDAGCMDEESVNELLIFMVGGLVNMVAIENRQRADLREYMRRTNQMAWDVLGAEGVR